MSVLVDSSVWIAASNAKNKECLALRRLIKSNELIYVTRPIQGEVCQGARTEEQFHRLWESFFGFEFLEVTDRIWGMSAWNYLKSRKKGLTLSTIDCLIATLAVENRVPLWTLDQGFIKMRSIIPFEIYSPGK